MSRRLAFAVDQEPPERENFNPSVLSTVSNKQSRDLAKSLALAELPSVT